MRRREFIVGAGSAAAWPITARAQKSPVPIIGNLYAGNREGQQTNMTGFLRGLREMGFIEGQNIALEYRWADNNLEQLPSLAADLVRRGVTIICADGGAVSVRAAQAATKTIPIVFHVGQDPVKAGLVASFDRPGENITGISFINEALTAKRMGLLHDLLPRASRFAALLNSTNPPTATFETAEAQGAANALGCQIEFFSAGTANEIDAAFPQMLQKRAEALLIGTSPLFSGRAQQIATLAARHGLPAIHFFRGFVDLGGLMSYGSRLSDTHRLAGIYVGRILKGEHPAELPVMQPTRFYLAINLTTAKALGIDVPPMLLALADEVVE
jgi:putative tryptophan/tyrosine transport system substrate-binding protein